MTLWMSLSMMQLVRENNPRKMGNPRTSSQKQEEPSFSGKKKKTHTDKAEKNRLGPDHGWLCMPDEAGRSL